MKKVIIVALVIIVMANLVTTIWFGGKEDIRYSNATGTFTFDELNFTGRNFQLCKDNWQAFKAMNKTDTILYRVTPINSLKFWRWADFVTREKYRLPYKSWKDIEARRGPVYNFSNFQNF